MNNELGIVGYLDDGNEFADLKENLEEYIHLLLVENCNTLEDVLAWISKNRVECLVVDHKLNNKYDFMGTEAIAFINKNIPDLPCIIVTSYKNDSIKENLVMELLIKDREDLPGIEGKYSIFGEQLKQACTTFKNRLEQREEQFKVLYEKKTSKIITTQEEESLRQVYNLLRAYGEIDDIPAEILTSEMSEKMDALLEKLDKCITDKDCNCEQ